MTPEIEIGSWTHKTTYMSDIDISEEEFEGFAEANAAPVNALLEEAWNCFVDAKKRHLNQEFERYIDGVVAMCNRSHRETMRLIEIEDAWTRSSEV
jgi:hypothetical protein